MIFKDKLAEKKSLIDPEIHRLFDVGLKNQSHSGDLLLWLVNGHFSEDIAASAITPKLSPYVIGKGKEGLAEDTHFSFIDLYRTRSIYKEPFTEYIKRIAYEPARKDEIDQLVFEEGITIQVEMMIYLKIWEADMTIKKLYEFVRILHHEHFDWHFKVASSNRDKATGTRQDIIRLHVRDKLEPISPLLSDLIKSTYLTQLRNSIAHSNYSFLGRHIHPNNFVASDPAAQLKAVSFDNWVDIFHSTLMLQNGLIKLANLIYRHYSDLSLKNNNLCEIQIVKLDGTSEAKNTYYREQFTEWVWEDQMK